jgi:hypothetical protein
VLTSGCAGVRPEACTARKLPQRPTIRRPPQIKSPAAERRRAHTSETRISAIAHPAAGCTRKKKALRLFPRTLAKSCASRALRARADPCRECSFA